MQLLPTPTLTDYKKQNTLLKHRFNTFENKMHTTVFLYTFTPQ